MSRKPVMLVYSPADWAKLLSPVRFQVMEVIRSIGPCSIAQVAVHLGRPPDALYRHIHVLQKLGIVIHAGFRKTERQAEEIFDLAADDVRIGFDEKSRRGVREALAATSRMVFHTADKGLRAAIDSGDLAISDPDRNFLLSYDLTWLTPEAFAVARQHVNELHKILDEGRKLQKGRLYASAHALFPVVSSRHRSPQSSNVSRRSRRTTAASKRRASSSEPST